VRHGCGAWLTTHIVLAIPGQRVVVWSMYRVTADSLENYLAFDPARKSDLLRLL
jgi:hypothetical protein